MFKKWAIDIFLQKWYNYYEYVQLSSNVEILWNKFWLWNIILIFCHQNLEIF